MIDQRRFRFVLGAILFLSGGIVAAEGRDLAGKDAKILPVTVSVDAGVTVASFIPFQVFGNNVPSWIDPVPVKDKVQAAGNHLLRIPGGSWGDVYRWNGKGEFDKQGNWVPSRTEYARSVLVKDYQSRYFPSRITDGKDDTAWQSHPETDFPEAQWVYIDFGAKKDVSGARIAWGNVAQKRLPYPKRFTVQYWDPNDGRQWMPYGSDKDAWLPTTARDLKGKGGVQEVTFDRVNTQYLRVLMSASSAGKKGTYSVAEFTARHEGVTLTLAGWQPHVASSLHTADGPDHDAREVFGFEQHMDFQRSLTPPAEPLVIVNFGTGTPQEAAAWVHYANQVKGYGIRYWEIGNELNGHWEAGGPLNATDYARRFILFAEAMKAEDPGITVIGPVSGHDTPSCSYNGRSYLQDFVGRLVKAGKADLLGGISIHHYANWGQSVPDLLDSPVTQVPAMAATIRQQIAEHPNAETIPVWLTEFNTSDAVKPQDVSVRLENGIWLAQYLAEWAKAFGTRGYTQLWDVMNGGSALEKETGGDHGYLQAESGPYQYQERADYWTMKLLTNRWALPGDKREHRMVEASTPEKRLSVYANRRPDGVLSLLVVNKDPENSYRASLALKGVEPGKKAKGWRFDANNYRWRTDEKPYHADPSREATPFKVDAGKGGKFSCVFTPYSITVVQFEE